MNTLQRLSLVAIVSSATIVWAQQDDKARGAVLLAGTANSQHLPETLDAINDTLKANGIKVWVPYGDSRPRVTLLDEAKKNGAASLLYVTLSQNTGRGMSRGWLMIQCFDPEGKELWTEEIKGGRIAKSIESDLKGILKTAKDRVAARAGGPGLPKAGTTQ